MMSHKNSCYELHISLYNMLNLFIGHGVAG